MMQDRFSVFYGKFMDDQIRRDRYRKFCVKRLFVKFRTKSQFDVNTYNDVIKR